MLRNRKDYYEILNLKYGGIVDGNGNKVLAVTAGVAGVVGAATMVSGHTVAAATGTVSYRAGATTVWASPAFKQAKRYLTFNQSVNVLGSKTVNGSVWYQIGSNEWVPSVYLKVGQAATSTPTPAKPTPAKPAPSQPVQQAPTTSGQIKLQVSYQGGAVTVWKTTAFSGTTGQYLTHGQTVTAVSKTVVNGATWYRLSSGGYVPAQYLKAAGQTTAPSQPAKPAPSQPAKPAPSQPNNNEVAQAPGVANPTAVAAVINLARQQIGKPYAWGGKGPTSFDCSGLMSYVFQNAVGKAIGGWTVPQESSGVRVSISALKPGDLVFWGNAGNTYHVALYVGGGQMIDAPRPGYNVQLTAISPYWAPSFGVRVL
ncbi:C40 family peptidase [Lacticaseibacillus saniviri]|uniref:C40 family peptidase n=1 Tax=Lacticaseibacillus saniviri TaxID=931533 RepID=UPI000AEFE070